MPGGGRGRRIYEGYILIARINSRGYTGALLITSSGIVDERERESIRKRTGPRRTTPRRTVRAPAYDQEFYLLSARRFIKN